MLVKLTWISTSQNDYYNIAHTLPSCLALLAALLAADGRLSRQTEPCNLKIFSRFALSAIMGLRANVTQPLVLVGNTLLWDTISVKTIKIQSESADITSTINTTEFSRSHLSESCSRSGRAECPDPDLHEHGAYIYQLWERQKHIREHPNSS